MNKLLFTVLCAFSLNAAAFDFGGILKGLGDAGASKNSSSTANLSDQDVTHGLKDALAEGAGKAVGLLGRNNGYLNNDKVRIPLPDSLQKAESVMKVLGQGKSLEELRVSLNRAAEAAVPEAKVLLTDAIKNMSVTDAKGVLTGGEDSATQYFRKATGVQLHDRFLPIVSNTVNRFKLSEQYDSIAGTASKAGLIGKEQANMAEYVTNKALDGLFLMIAEEEKAIRQNPVGRSSEYVRKVFGSLKTQ